MIWYRRARALRVIENTSQQQQQQQQQQQKLNYLISPSGEGATRWSHISSPQGNSQPAKEVLGGSGRIRRAYSLAQNLANQADS